MARVDRLFTERRSFNCETTLTGHGALLRIQRAYEQGYRVFLYYLGVSSPDVAIDRIRHRVDRGGHDIDPETVRKRYQASLANLSKALPFTEEAHVLDNTVAFKRIGVWHRNTLCWWGASRETGSWLADAIIDERLWHRD